MRIKKKKAMKTTERLFTAAGVQAVRHYLQSMKEQHRPRSYRVLLDGIEIVPLTYELSSFNDYLLHVGENNTRITFMVYHRHKLEYMHRFSLDGKLSEAVLQATTVRVDSLAWDGMKKENARLFVDNLKKDWEIAALKMEIVALREKISSEAWKNALEGNT